MNITENFDENKLNASLLNQEKISLKQLSDISGIPALFLKKEFFGELDFDDETLIDIHQIREIMLKYLDKEFLNR